MAVLEDDIIKRKLLIEGDGGNDEKRINGLLRTFIKWCSSTDATEESDVTLQKMISILTHCQLTVQKSLEVFHMNLKEQQNYENIDSEIDHQMKITYKHIDECKGELRSASCIRKNKQEYDLLAKVIQQNPDRHDTLEHLSSIDQELLKLEETKVKFNEMLNARRKQFYVLLSSIHELQKMLEEDSVLTDDNDGEYEEMETN